MSNDAALMEASLVAMADTDIRHSLYERFFAAFPDRKPIFYNMEVSSRRMTDETLQMMHGLAAGEKWVWPLVCELMFTHRNYGHLPMAEYDAFIDMTVDEVERAAGEAWTPVWRTYADQLKVLINRAKDEWTEAMPGQKSAA